jgi:hypothetical protein
LSAVFCELRGKARATVLGTVKRWVLAMLAFPKAEKLRVAPVPLRAFDRACAPCRPEGVGTKGVPRSIDHTPPARVEQRAMVWGSELISGDGTPLSRHHHSQERSGGRTLKKRARNPVTSS